MTNEWSPLADESLFASIRNFGVAPLVATAVHHGSRVRAEVDELLALDEATRHREEDLHTGSWTRAAPIAVVALRSRFEVDLNRPRHHAVYLRPEDAWGLTVWKHPPPEDLVTRSLAIHDAFYSDMACTLDRLCREHRRFLVLDLHSYNHRRAGPDGPEDDPSRSPDINLGTGSLRSVRWRPLVDRFLSVTDRARVGARTLTVGENVRFKGGYFPTWVNERYGDLGCALAVEVKKFFMDEWTGAVHAHEMQDLHVFFEQVVGELTRALDEAEAA